MSASRDVLRLINGVFLVAKEFAKPSQPKNGDLGTLISSSVKKAVVSATDLAGITSGNVRQFSPPRPKQSVVYFTDSPEIKTVNDSESALDLENSNEKTENTVLKADLEENNGVSVRGFERLTESNAGNDHVTENLREIDSGKDPDYVKISENDQRNYNDLANSRERNGETVQPVKKRKPRERRVPSTPFTRALGFAGLGAGLAWGTIQESAKRLVFGGPKLQDGQSALSPFLSEQNAERLALALCRMRGAALKLGQMLSIQDETLIPAPILSALDIVRQGADVMPRSQLNHVLDTELGHDWSSKLKSFDYEPMAAASIGQVHRAFTRDNLEVAMKIQYPGVADSIESDIENVKRLLDYTNVIPKGLYLDSAMKVAKEELSRECEYELEAENQRRFRELLFNTEGFYVPIVIDDLSSRRVLTTELVPGIPIDKVASLNQETRDYVGKKLLELTLKELFVFRFMQTDPNWSNFLYDESTRMINLIDFGAAREYPQVFVDDYLKMVLACAVRDRDRVIEMSRRLGFLTGMESEIMLDAHVQAGFIVGLPFSRSGGFDFRTTKITQSISDLGATMLKHRLTPPPDEAYSLHRKLSGAFLACIKLGSVVPCRDLFFQIYEQYQSSDDGNTILATSTP